MDRYGHLSPDEFDAVALRLDAAVRQTGVYRTCTPADLALFDDDGSVTQNAV